MMCSLQGAVASRPRALAWLPPGVARVRGRSAGKGPSSRAAPRSSPLRAGEPSSAQAPSGSEARGVETDSREARPADRVLAALLGVYAACKVFLLSVVDLLVSPWSLVRSSERWRQDGTRRALKLQADKNPRDATLQALYLRELVKVDPRGVISRVESRRFNNNSPGTVAAFVEALGRTGEVWKYVHQTPAELQALGVLHGNLRSLLSDLANLAGGQANGTRVGTAMNPMQVFVQGTQSFQPGQRPGSLLDVTFKSVSLFVNLSLISLAALVFFAVLDRSAASGQKGSAPGSANNGVSAADASLGFGPGSFAPKQYNKDVLPEKDVKTFKDVCGCPEAKAELEEIVEFLKNPSQFTRLGAKLPKGVLLYGPPGTGKTLLAKAVAGEAGVPFFYRAGSEFEEMYVGVGSRRVRALFQAAKKAAPCIVFIDEIDAVGGSRKALENQAARKTLNQLLVEMDGFDANEGIIVMAATNIPDSLDAALTRPGRFDRHVNVPLPDVKGRTEILEHYLSDKPMAPAVDAKRYARATPGFSGADLFNLVNEAALTAAKTHRDRLEAWMLDEARDKVSMGAARKSAIIPESERRNTAFHEAGHALVALRTRGAMPIHKATIIPRGHALGMVQQVPDDDYSSLTVEQMLAKLDVCMGGRVAEHLVFGWDKVSAGASNDLWQASRLARAMVTQYGLSPVIGPVAVSNDGVSADLQRKVDEEVGRLVGEAYKRVERLLSEERDALERLAEALLQHETLTGEEVGLAVEGRLVKDGEDGDAPKAGPAEAVVEASTSVEQAPSQATLRAAGSGGMESSSGASAEDATVTSISELVDLIRAAAKVGLHIEMRRDGRTEGGQGAGTKGGPPASGTASAGGDAVAGTGRPSQAAGQGQEEAGKGPGAAGGKKEVRGVMVIVKGPASGLQGSPAREAKAESTASKGGGGQQGSQ